MTHLRVNNILSNNYLKSIIYMILVDTPLEASSYFPGIYEKLPYKGETYRFSGKRDPSVQTNIQLLYAMQAMNISRRKAFL